MNVSTLQSVVIRVPPPHRVLCMLSQLQQPPQMDHRVPSYVAMDEHVVPSFTYHDDTLPHHTHSFEATVDEIYQLHPVTERKSAALESIDESIENTTLHEHEHGVEEMASVPGYIVDATHQGVPSSTTEYETTQVHTFKDDMCDGCKTPIMVKETGREVNGDLVPYGCVCGWGIMRIEIDDTGSKQHFCRDWIATPREATLSSGLPASLDISLHSDHIPDTIASANPDGSPDDFCGDCEIKIFLSETGDEVDGDIVECYCGCGFAELQVWFDASTGNKTYRFTDWQEWLVDTHPDSEAVMEADDEVGTVPDYESTTVGDDESSLTKSTSTVHGGTCIDCKSAFQLSGEPIDRAAASVIFCGCGIGVVGLDADRRAIPNSITDWQSWAQFYADRFGAAATTVPWTASM